MQGRWPIRDFKFRWRPGGLFSATLFAEQANVLGIVTKQDLDSILISGKRIPAILDEPWSPPDAEMRASLTTYYLLGPKDQEEFWNEAAGSFNRRAESFARKKLILEAVAAMDLPRGTDLRSRLKAAYDWIDANLINTALRTSEEVEMAADEADQRRAWNVGDLLERREGPGWQLDYLYMGVARALGADAHLVYTANRPDHYFHPDMLTVEQIDATLVAIAPLGEPDETRVFVDPGSGLPFGQVPWWTSGMRGLLAMPDKGVHIPVPPSQALDNLSHSRVSISFNADDGTGIVHWTRVANGQSGLTDRRAIRSMSPEQRAKRLEDYCGSSGDIDVVRAQAALVDKSAGPLDIACDTILTHADMDTQRGEHLFSFMGPWIESVPELVSEKRVSPIVFPFPRADRTTIDITVPAGFHDRTAPSPVRLDTPYGRYILDVTPTPEGFHVERLFSLVSIAVPAAEYPALRAYLTAVRRADLTMVSFRKSSDAP